jgi:hypothetical protein
MSAAQLRHLLHHLAIKHFTVGVFVALDTVAAPSAPLFEEEGGSGTSQGACPRVTRIIFILFAFCFAFLLHLSGGGKAYVSSF